MCFELGAQEASVNSASFMAKVKWAVSLQKEVPAVTPHMSPHLGGLDSGGRWTGPRALGGRHGSGQAVGAPSPRGHSSGGQPATLARAPNDQKNDSDRSQKPSFPAGFQESCSRVMDRKLLEDRCKTGGWRTQHGPRLPRAPRRLTRHRELQAMAARKVPSAAAGPQVRAPGPVS